MDISRIRLVREDVAVWLVYAGSGRRFFQLFERTNRIFLSLPGFDANDTVFQSDEAIRQHLAMSDEIGRWVSGARPDVPSRRPSAYSPNPYLPKTPDANSFSAELGNIYRMFIDAKPGDLILSPPYGHYDPYLVGEIIGPWKKDDDLEVPQLLGEKVPTRKVRWLNTALARRDFAPKVSRRLQNKHAITRIDSRHYEDILETVYPSFVWGDTSKLDVFGDDYTGTDPLQTYPAARLVKYVLASVFAFEKGEFAQFQALEADAAIATYYDESLVQEFGQNFNSPGKFSIVASLGSLAILASAGLIVASSDHAQNFGQTKSEAAQSVKGAMVGADKAARGQELDAYINSMEAVNWKKVQRELGKPAKDKLNISLDNKVEVAAHRAALDDK